MFTKHYTKLLLMGKMLMEYKKIITPGKWYAEFDKDGNLTKAIQDKSFREILGYATKEEYDNAYAKWSGNIHPDDRKRLADYLAETKKARKNGLDYDIEYRMMTKWGYRWFHDYAHCTHREDGSLERCDGIIFDINDAKNMNAIMGSIPISHDVLKQSKIGLWAIEFDEGREPRMFGDEAMISLIGINDYVAPEDVYRIWSSHIDKEHIKEVQESIEKMSAGIHSEVQYPWHCDDGTNIIVRCGGTKNPQYKKGVRIEGILRDVTTLVHHEKEMQEKVQESIKVIQSFTKSYDIAYQVNLANDTFLALKKDKNMIGYDKNFDGFTKAMEFFVSEVVFGPDKDRMRREVSYDVIRKKLSENQSYSVEYRVPSDKTTIWHEMNIKALDENQIAIGFTPNNQEILLQRIQRKVNEDYYALFSIDLDTELLTVIKNAPWYTVVQEGDSIDLSTILKFFLKDVAGDAKVFFEQFINSNQIRTIFTKEEKRSFTYLSILLKRWITISIYVIYRHDDNTPATLSLGFSFVDSFESKKQKFQDMLKENMEIIGGFTSEYLALYHMNIKEKSFKIYSVDNKLQPDTKQLLTESTDPAVLIQKFVNSPAVHPDDRPLFKDLNIEKVKEQLKDKKKFSIQFRRNYGQGYKWSIMDIVKNEQEHEEANAITIGFAECDNEIRREQVLINSLAILRKDETPDNAINEQLRLLGNFYGAECAYIFEYKSNRKAVQNTYRWLDKNFSVDSDRFQDISANHFDDWVNEFVKKGKYHIASVTSEPQMLKEETERLLKQGITNFIAYPLMKGNEIKGFIGVGNPTKTEYNEDVLKTAASISFCEILRRKENDEEHITLSKLTDAFVSVHYIDLSLDYIRTWKTGDLNQKEYGTEKKYSTTISNYIQKNIDDHDRERCMKMTSPDYILEQFKTKDRFSVELTDIFSGNDANIVFDYIKISEDGNQFVLCGKDMTESLSKQKEQQETLQEALSESRQANAKITQQKQLLDYFMQSYAAAYAIDFKSGVLEVLHINHEYSTLFPLDALTLNINKFIFEHIQIDDRESMIQILDKDYIVRRLKTEKFFSFTVRIIFESRVKSMRGIIVRGIDEYHAVIGFMDITDELRKEREQQERLQEALSMAQSANRAKTTFLNNMSHDIRTPMNAIMGYTGLASSHIDNKEQVQDYLGKISQASSHLLSLINDVLDMSRIESGKMNIEEKEENLSNIIQALKCIVQTDISAKKLNFYVDFVNVDDYDIVCDKLRLTQVLLNILSNAIKYTDMEGTITMQIMEVDKENDFGTYEFRIKDNGMGMSKEFLKTIYDPFTRVKSSTVSGIQGTGLGMSITKNIVDMMGGDIHIQSEIEKGTKVTITFDFKIINAKAKKECEQVEYDFNGKKVLLVEDNAFNREIATELLEDYGFDVTTAQDGNLAVDIMKSAKEGDFDLILMDIQMPTIDGYEATKQIRALNSEMSKLPIIAMTANAFEEDRKKALNVGMDEHITKPINLNELKSTLARILSRKRS